MSLWDNVKKFAQPYSDDDYDDYDEEDDYGDDDYDQPAEKPAPSRRAPRRAPAPAPVEEEPEEQEDYGFTPAPAASTGTAVSSGFCASFRRSLCEMSASGFRSPQMRNTSRNTAGKSTTAIFFRFSMESS